MKKSSAKTVFAGSRRFQRSINEIDWSSPASDLSMHLGIASISSKPGKVKLP